MTPERASRSVAQGSAARRRGPPGVWPRAFAVGCVGLLALGCNEALSAPDGVEVPSLMRAKAADEAVERAAGQWSHVPVPPEDGPRLAPLALITPVYETPNTSASPIGYLRLGAKVARSEQPVSREGCPEGWYAVRPVGFVCAGDGATTRLDHPLVRAFSKEPDRSQALPYKYAFVRSIAPNYLRIPTKEEQFKYELRLDRHLRNYKKLAERWDALDVGANDVPLGERGAASGPIPEHARPMGYNERFGGSGDDNVPWWLDGERRVPNISTFKAPPYAVIAGRIKRHAGVALVDTFVAGANAQHRRFAVTTDGRLLPTDKLKADSGSPFHGEELRDFDLPVGFAFRNDTRWHAFSGGRPERGEALPHRQLVPLTGKVKMWGGTRFVEARNGQWLRSEDLRIAAKPSTLPWFAAKGAKWIDVGLLSQTVVLYEGQRPIYVTLASSGRDGIGDPKTTLSTPQGTFRVYQKHITTKMDSTAADSEFELRDVPWVMYFKGGYAIHTAYWHDDFGRPRSHGCINLSPIDARYAFLWAAPDVPAHWHASYASEALGEGTLVHVHE